MYDEITIRSDVASNKAFIRFNIFGKANQNNNKYNQELQLGTNKGEGRLSYYKWYQIHTKFKVATLKS